MKNEINNVLAFWMMLMTVGLTTGLVLSVPGVLLIEAYIINRKK